MIIKGSRTFCRPSGSIDAKYVGVGEQPGRQEVHKRSVFCGPAGREWDGELEHAGIIRSETYMTNVIKDLDHYMDKYIQLYSKSGGLLKNPIISNMGQRHIDYLQSELKQTSAKVFFALGGIACYVLTGRNGITKWRGSLLDCTLVPGRKVVPMFHPATVIPPKNQYLNRRLIIFDIKKAREFADGLYIPTYREITIEPSFYETMEFLRYIYRKGLEGAHIAYDIEVHMKRKFMHVSCISFSTNLKAMSIPFTKGPDDYFTTDQECKVMTAIGMILEHEGIKKVAQNATFDGRFLLRRYGIKVNNIDDTMIAQQILMPEYPKGLDFVTSIWTDHPYYKADGKDFFAEVGALSKGWKYNATDSIICDEAIPKQLSQVKAQKNEPTYVRQRRVIEPCVYMMERGIKVDVEKMQQYAKGVENQIEEKWAELEDKCGQAINPNSSKDLKLYFKDKLGIKPYKKRRTNGTYSDSYDEIAMVRLKRRGFEEAGLILDIRRLRKAHSTYLDINKVDADGRSRCSYNPVGTRYSRLSSSANIFGTGGNHQNWPHHLQEFLIADDGFVYYAIDLSQAENRIVAYIGNVPVMIDNFEKGRDSHSVTAAMIFNKRPEDVTREDGTCPIGDGTHSERFWGKKANHGFNYDWGYRNFAIKNEIAEKEAKLIYNGFHSVYPEVKGSYHADIKRKLRKGRMLINLMGRKTYFFSKLDDDTFKEAYSCIPQGTVGDIINERGIEYIYYDQKTFEHVDLLRQVHDEIGFQIPISAGWKYHAKTLINIKQNLEPVLHTDLGREFVIPADISMGKTLNKESCHEMKKDKYSNNVEKFADILESEWDLINAA